MVDYHQKLLEAQLAQLDVGKLDSKTVLQAEEKLFESKVAAVDSLVSYRKALLELEAIDGVMLQNRGVELDKATLHQKTLGWLEAQKLPIRDIRSYQDQLVRETEAKFKNKN